MKTSSTTLAVALGASGTLFSTAFLWQRPIILTCVLVILAGFLLWRLKHRRFVVVYAFGFLLGPLTEIISISKGAWQYTAPVFFGIPYWLPFVWGLAAVTIAAAYETVRRKSELEEKV